MNIFTLLIIGGIGGWLIATFVKHSTSNFIDIILGLVGGFVGAFFANTFFGVPTSSVYTFLSAACGVVVFIFLGRLRAISR